ncbi:MULTISPECIES: glutathione-regulated potassium-efflux system oxidoreductase KefF [unclassified Pseudomonas]|uniref:glutathione-regulated potassium-efflux system oxidoreductase KefF n=1 Tax=unclassified Pseudomonas TaxID=196821 RepID=UPI00091B9E12|nr:MULTISPECIES: glutathione-regulated potassium-efflux system oxidoreductase KefF [unclassified Pseudomonas]MDB6444802.1 glutathione-regulated potassium-efflux system oxidoreductase KefF [Pseudomonas sp. 21TX0197]SFX23876.1 glutathione-regulated potassium-efflux system ancillary protein KefF [Pseudomonas sp. NFACC47-1]SFX53241.1 glutathione-regulated potassium-efflux system ancillary protein KefF [Pseudomonas sp. NFACC43]
MILIVYAHPYPDQSRVNQQMLERVSGHPDVVVRSLYDLYPDFAIDVEAEQRVVEQAQLVVLQHPMYWYSMPPLLKLWIDKVFTHGWAYGRGTTALKGKSLLWAVTTGGDQAHFQIGAHPGFSVLAQPLHATALYCHMRWLEPVVVHGAYAAESAAQHAQIEHYAARLAAWKED